MPYRNRKETYKTPTTNFRYVYLIPENLIMKNIKCVKNGHKF